MQRAYAKTWRLAAGLCTALAAVGGAAGAVQAAELTDVIDSFDKKDPFDFHLEVSFFRTLSRAKIVREGCIERTDADMDGSLIPCTLATTDGRVTTYNDLRWDRVDAGIEIEPRIGLGPDFNLFAKIPIYISSTRRLTPSSRAPCGPGSGETCMPINPTSIERDGLLNDETTGSTGSTGMLDGGSASKDRSGLGDMFIGLELGLFNQDRDSSKAFWVIGIGSTVPSGTVARVDNAGMGRGTFSMAAWMNFSRRFAFLEPYSGIRVEYEVPIRDSLFSETHYAESGQRTWSPGIRGAIYWGLEIVPLEKKEKGLKLSFDLGLKISYISEGRDYSELFDFIAESDPCEIGPLAGPYAEGGALYDAPTHGLRDDGMGNCAPAPVDSDGDGMTDTMIPSVAFNGITDVEQHLAYEGHLTLNFHVPIAPPHVTAYIGLTGVFTHVQEHFLTFGDAGIDSGNRARDGNDGVVDECTPAFYENGGGSGIYECNPNFQPVFDLPGRRFKLEESSIFTFMATARIEF